MRRAAVGLSQNGSSKLGRQFDSTFFLARTCPGQSANLPSQFRQTFAIDIA